MTDPLERGTDLAAKLVAVTQELGAGQFLYALGSGDNTDCLVFVAVGPDAYTFHNAIKIVDRKLRYEAGGLYDESEEMSPIFKALDTPATRRAQDDGEDPEMVEDDDVEDDDTEAYERRQDELYDAQVDRELERDIEARLQARRN